jgi:hypothetical protein
MSNDRPANPKRNDAWVDDNDELWYFDGLKWVLYEDLPDTAELQPEGTFRGDSKQAEQEQEKPEGNP